MWVRFFKEAAVQGLVFCGPSVSSSGEITRGDFTHDAFHHLLDREFGGVQTDRVWRSLERGNATLAVALVTLADLAQ
jgi:hypothetical protein